MRWSSGRVGAKAGGDVYTSNGWVEKRLQS